MAAEKATGRPSKFKPEFVDQARKLCELGATDREVADFFGVALSTLGEWKSVHPDFMKALIVGKEAADDRVERSLYQRAVGYSYEAKKVFQFQGTPVVVDYTETMPPDTTACIFWLKNRRREAWRDRQDHEVTGAEGVPLVPIINLAGRPESASASAPVAGIRDSRH